MESTDTKVANKAHSHQRTVNTSALSSDELSLIVPSVPHRGESGVPMKCTTRENRAHGHPRLSLDGLRVVFGFLQSQSSLTLPDGHLAHAFRS